MTQHEYRLCRSTESDQAACATRAEADGFIWFGFAPNSDVWLRREIRPVRTTDVGDVRVTADGDRRVITE